MEAESSRKAPLTIGVAGSLIILGLSVFVAEPGSTYRWAFLFLLPLVWGVYLIRERLALHPAHFALFVGAILFHNLGAFGWYERALLGLRFDVYVHYAFGLVAGLILGRLLRLRLSLSTTVRAMAVGLLVLGIGAIHELIECGTTLVLGPEKGMLKIRPDEPFDTQKDLFNNLLGALTAVLIQLKRPDRPPNDFEPSGSAKPQSRRR